MNEEQFDALMSEVISKLETGQGGHVDQLTELANKTNMMQELKTIIGQISDTLGFVRLLLKYMRFDLEATKRECDTLRTMLEDRD